jgi:tetratricopeptide (TPR) repeat protein
MPLHFRHVTRHACICFFSCFFGLAAVAQSAPPILVTENGQIYPVKALVAEGDYAAARQQARAITAGSPTQTLWTRLAEGLILADQKRYDEAARIFREILTEAPDFELARLELTSALVRSGQREAALYHAQRLAATTDNERFRQDLEALLEASQGRPWGVSLSFGIEPSTNLNRGSSQETIAVGDTNLVIDNQAKEGVALQLGATAFRRWSLNENWGLTLSGGVAHRQVISGESANETSLSFRLPLTRRLERGPLSFGPFYERTFSDGSRYRDRAGLEASLSVSPQPDRTWFARGSWAEQDYSTLDYLDGYRRSLRIGYARQTSAALSWGIDASLLRETSGLEHLNHSDFGLGAFVERDWRSGITTAFRADVVQENYDGVFPSKSFARADTETRLRVSVRNRNWQIGPVTPELSYTFTNSSSNVEFYDYDSHDVGIALSSRF